MKVPLYKALSKLGYASRTKAASLIAAGEIRVDGVPCRDPEHPVSLHTADIRHGETQIRAEPLKVIMLYKPKSVITSSKDEQGRKTVFDLLPAEYQNLHAVGRLDYATTGLLLLTNNTKLSSWLTDPEHGVPRVYVVTVRGMMTPEKAAKMMSGIMDEGQELRPDSVIVRKSSNRESHLVITLSEGKNREIRRLCKSTGNEVTKLKRVAYGPLTLGEMQPGEFREVGISELQEAFPGFHRCSIV